MLAGAATWAMAGAKVRDIDWSTQRAGAKGFEVLPASADADFARARVTGSPTAPRTVTVLELDDPGITRPFYVLTGKVRYWNVGGEGYLEMWSHFPGGRKHFTRTRAASGPMARLTGTSVWRVFVLPFMTAHTKQRPSKLVIKVVLPRGGTVELGPLELRQARRGEDPLSQLETWWPDRTGGLIGGLLGLLLGGLGAAVGVLSSTGKHRGLVMGLMLAGTIFGAILFAAGVGALATRQPYAVYYPLTLAGGLAAVLFTALRPGVRRRYDALERRRRRAKDVT
jgi:hypothetical protein